MNEDIKLRYIKWNQSIDKLTTEMAEYSQNLSGSDINYCDSTLDNFVKRLRKLKAELEDIIDWEDVDDFLENGSGLLTLSADVLE